MKMKKFYLTMILVLFLATSAFAKVNLNTADAQELATLPGIGPGVSDEKVAEQVEIQEKYAGYIKRQQEEVEKSRKAEAVKLPDTLDYKKVKGLSSEVREKLLHHRPETLGKAGRIPGVTPAAVSLLLIHLKKHRA